MPKVFLSFGHADQGVFRVVHNLIDGVVVPGTIATYFREATGGFVMSLGRPYAIDPRTPTFQYGIPVEEIRSSHLSLAREHGESFLDALTRARTLADIPSRHWVEASESIAHFQRDYAGTSAARIAKYAALLGKQPAAPRAPFLILPAYLMIEEADFQPQWDLNLQMARAAKAVADGSGKAFAAVLALKSPNRNRPNLQHLDMMLRDVRSEGVTTTFFWLNDFNEREVTAEVVSGFGRLLADHNGLIMYALYGGFLSLSLSRFGLAGINSGVGYSESRDATELFRTGAPRPRYYHPLLRDFLNPDIAELLARQRDAAIQCPCHICQAEPVRGIALGRLDLRSLMIHFVQTRVSERELVERNPPLEIAAILEQDAATMRRAAERLPGRLSQEVSIDHLTAWASGLRALAK